MSQHYFMQDLWIESQRKTGTRRPINVINPNKYSEFFTRLNECRSMDAQFQLYVAIALSAGLRVSEGLGLRLVDFDFETGFFKIRVLKKRSKVQGANGMLDAHKVYREGLLHPVALQLLIEYIEETRHVQFREGRKAIGTLRNYDFVFTMDRFRIDELMKRYFGPHACAHSLRHSYISWLKHVKNRSSAKIGGLVKISPRLVDESYNHIDERTELLDLSESED